MSEQPTKTTCADTHLCPYSDLAHCKWTSSRQCPFIARPKTPKPVAEAKARKRAKTTQKSSPKKS